MQNEDKNYHYQQEEAMSVLNTNRSHEQGVADLEDILGEEAEYYNLEAAVDKFHMEAGHVDIHAMYDAAPESIDYILEGHLKPEYADI